VRYRPARCAGREDIAALIEPVFHNPVDDGSAILQQNIGRAIAIIVACPNNAPPSGVRGEDVPAYVLAALHNPVDDGAAVLQQNVVPAISSEIPRADDVPAGRAVAQDIAAQIGPVF
jgi:hypothetical protein